jgi:hypothetical protein
VLGGNVSVLLGNDLGGFSLPVTYAAGTTPQSVSVADVNGDGKPDLLVTDYNRVLVLLGTGTGSFGAPIAFYVDPSLVPPSPPTSTAMARQTLSLSNPTAP